MLSRYDKWRGLTPTPGYVRATDEDGLTDGRNQISMLVSEPYDAIHWSNMAAVIPVGEDEPFHSAYLPPAITCNYQTHGSICTLMFTNYNHADGLLSKIWSVQVLLTGSTTNPIINVGDRDMGDVCFTNIALAFSDVYGWFMAFGKEPVNNDHMRLKFRSAGSSFFSNWNSTGNRNITAQTGYSAAYNARKNIFRTTWIRY